MGAGFQPSPKADCETHDWPPRNSEQMDETNYLRFNERIAPTEHPRFSGNAV